MDRKQLYSVSLKLLTLFGVVIVMAVMINSLFPVEDVSNPSRVSNEKAEPVLVKVDVGSLLTGKMMHVSWAGRSVGIVHRVDPPKDFIAGEPLNGEWRSLTANYFIFYNSSGVSQCPLYLIPEGNRLKDTCSGQWYDTRGERVDGQGEALQIPPHYFESNNTLVIGQWAGEVRLEGDHAVGK